MMRIVVICACFAVCYSAKFPSYFSKCSKSDPQLDECLTKNAKDGWSEMIKGDKSAHIQQLNPFLVPFMALNVDNNLKGNITDCIITGLDETDIHSVKLDLHKNTLDVKFKTPRINFQGSYVVSGRILLLPIQGKGPSNITFADMDNDLHMEFTVLDKNNKQYIEIKDTSMKYTTTRAYFGLDNLFGGDKTLGDAMKKVLDENWEAVNEEIGRRVGDVVGAAFSGVLKSFFRRISLDELFSDE